MLAGYDVPAVCYGGLAAEHPARGAPLPLPQPVPVAVALAALGNRPLRGSCSSGGGGTGLGAGSQLAGLAGRLPAITAS